MRVAGAWLVGVGLAACGGGAHPGGPDASAPIDGGPADAAGVPWWHPAPGEARDWDIQLVAPIDVSAPRTMYDLDLWSLVPAPITLDYGDGDPVTVPAGAQAGTIAALHARTPSTIVICHVDTGAVELARPDARKFPGYEAKPPDRPTAPKAGSVIGWSVDGPGERFLDLRLASRARFEALIWKRLELAQQIGCDGVDADRNDVTSSTTGFTVPEPDQRSWYQAVAAQAHQRGLSIDMRDGHEISGETDQLVELFDWAIVQRCGEYDDCDGLRPFYNAGKASLAIDYQSPDGQGGGVPAAAACLRQTGGLIYDGLVKDFPPSAAVRTQCMP